MAVTQAFPRELLNLLIGLPGHVDNVHLAGGGAAKTVTIPAGATSALLSPYPRVDFLVNTVGGTATRNGSDITDGSATLPNPTGLRNLTPGETLSFIAGADDVDVALVWAREPGA